MKFGPRRPSPARYRAGADVSGQARVVASIAIPGGPAVQAETGVGTGSRCRTVPVGVGDGGHVACSGGVAERRNGSFNRQR